MIDVDNLVTPLSRVITGADPKEWVECDGDSYLMKWGKEGNELAPYSEFVASRFMHITGLPVQQVDLVIYKGKPCAMCKDVGDIKHFINITESSLDTDETDKYYCVEDVLHEIECMSKLDTTQRIHMQEFFKYLFINDAVLANRDRHAGNWGYTAAGEPCPIFDNGAALFPSILHYEETNIKRLFHRLTLEEPKSSVQRMTREGKLRKHNFYYILEDSDFFSREIAKLNGCRIPQRIDTCVDDLPADLAWFYKRLILLRYYCVIGRYDFEMVYGRLERESPTTATSVLDLLQRLSHL